MKHILLSFLSLLPFIGFNQAFSVETDDTTLYGSPTENTFYGDIDLFNQSSDTLTLGWENIEQNIPDGWEVSNCDPAGCAPIGVLTGSFELAPSAEGLLNTHFYPNGVPGQGYVKINVFDINNPSDSIVLTYYGNANSATINEVSELSFDIFPNPATHHISIIGSGILNQDIFVYDALGRKVLQSKGQFNGKSDLDIKKLKSGVYLVKINKTAHRFVKR